MTLTRRLILLFALGMIICPAFVIGKLSAETVLLNRGIGQYGLGWLFRQQDGDCRIATPRHVIQAEGQLVPADMVDRFGRHHATFNPVPAQDPDLDLAFLEVRGTMAEQGCSSSRLSSIGIRTAIDQMETGILTIATPFDRQTLHIERRATSRDAAGGLYLAIGPKPGSPSLMQGMSGGAIITDKRPVAMLLEVDTSTGTGIALRFDIIADELNKLPPKPTAKKHILERTYFEELIIHSGQIASPVGSIGMFLNGYRSLTLKPEDDRVSFYIKLNRIKTINGITISSTMDNDTGKLIIEVSQGDKNFVVGRICNITFSGENQECYFSPRNVDNIRITIPTNSYIIDIDSLKINTAPSEVD